MPDIQKSRPSVPPPNQTTEHEVQGVQPPEPNEPPPFERLDGEFTKIGDEPFGAGPHCEVWKGQWENGGVVKKVRLRLIMSTPLTWPFVGGLENTSNASATWGDT